MTSIRKDYIKKDDTEEVGDQVVLHIRNNMKKKAPTHSGEEKVAVAAPNSSMGISMSDTYKTLDQIMNDMSEKDKQELKGWQLRLDNDADVLDGNKPIVFSKPDAKNEAIHAQYREWENKRSDIYWGAIDLIIPHLIREEHEQYAASQEFNLLNFLMCKKIPKELPVKKVKDLPETEKKHVLAIASKYNIQINELYLRDATDKLKAITGIIPPPFPPTQAYMRLYHHKTKTLEQPCLVRTSPCYGK